MRTKFRSISAPVVLSPRSSVLRYSQRYGISLRMFFDSTAETSVDCRSRLFRFFPLLDSKWLLKPLFLLILPLPVTLKRFIAALLLFILGTSPSFLAGDWSVGVME